MQRRLAASLFEARHQLVDAAYAAASPAANGARRLATSGSDTKIALIGAGTGLM